MPAADSPAIIVARFLKANHYNDVSLLWMDMSSNTDIDSGTLA